MHFCLSLPPMQDRSGFYRGERFSPTPSTGRLAYRRERRLHFRQPSSPNGEKELAQPNFQRSPFVGEFEPSNE